MGFKHPRVDIVQLNMNDVVRRFIQLRPPTMSVLQLSNVCMIKQLYVLIQRSYIYAPVHSSWFWQKLRNFGNELQLRLGLVGLALWLVSGIALKVPLWIRHPLLHNCPNNVWLLILLGVVSMRRKDENMGLDSISETICFISVDLQDKTDSTDNSYFKINFSNNNARDKPHTDVYFWGWRNVDKR